MICESITFLLYVKYLILANSDGTHKGKSFLIEFEVEFVCETYYDQDNHVEDLVTRTEQVKSAATTPLLRNSLDVEESTQEEYSGGIPVIAKIGLKRILRVMPEV